MPSPTKPSLTPRPASPAAKPVAPAAKPAQGAKPAAKPGAPVAKPVAPAAKPAAGPAQRDPGDRLAFSEAVAAAKATWTFPRAVETSPPGFAVNLANVRHVAKKNNSDEWEEGYAERKAEGKTGARSYEEMKADKLKYGRDRKASQEVAANYLLEVAGVKQLPAAQAEAYRRVAQAVAGDPMARLALQKLLFNGELPGEPAHDGKAFLTQLDGLLSSPLMPGLDATELAGNLIQEAAEPTAIQQGFVRTCAATTCQIQLAKRWPAEYARLVVGLASPKGEVAMANGEALTRKPFAKTERDRADTGRLFQDALMEHANGPDEAYDVDADKNVNLKDPSRFAGSGLGPADMDRALRALWGDRTTFSAVEAGDWGVEACLVATEGALKLGKDVPSGFTWGEDEDPIKRMMSGHAVLITGMDAEGVTVANPHGAVQKMPLAAFKERIRTVHVPNELAPQGPVQPSWQRKKPEAPKPVVPEAPKPEAPQPASPEAAKP